MKRFRALAVTFALSVFALTGCFFIQPAPASDTQETSSQTGTSSSALMANGSVELRLTVQGDGYVNFTPPGENCGPTTICTFEFVPGTDIAIYTDAPAIPGSNHSFKEWGDDCAMWGTNQYPDLTITRSMNCSAEFTPEGR